jgi:glucose/mannose-6-phosphate isomerase
MDLDNIESFKKLDPQNMLGEIEALPGQLQSAWELGQTSEVFKTSEVSRIVIAGMGGSAIGADLLTAYIAPVCRLPVIVHRDYGLPAWAHGPETLVVASSHSGYTEETLDAFDVAFRAGCRILAICTGGELEQRAIAHNVPVWKFNHAGQPRAAVGFSFGLLLAAFTRLGLVPDLEKDLLEAVAGMRSQQETLRVHVPLSQNPAKRMTGGLVGRWINVYGSGMLAPVARRWKGQMNEVAKAGAGFEALPEADHNALAGLKNPPVLMQTVTLFLRAPSDHPRNSLRAELTRHGFMVGGLNTDVYHANGASPLAHVWTALHFGDYLAYYLAMSYGMDPTPVEALQDLKAAMQAAR